MKTRTRIMSLFAAFIISATAAPAVLPQTVAFAASTAKKSLENYRINIFPQALEFSKSFEKYTPMVDIVDSTGNSAPLVKDTDYTVTYKNNDRIGTATVIVKGKGNYKGTLTASFDIIPQEVESFRAIKNGKKVDFTWDKVAGVDGYSISASKNGGDYNLLTVVKKNTTKTTVNRNLSAKDNWSFLISAYKVVNGKKYYSIHNYGGSYSVLMLSTKNLNLSIVGKQIDDDTATITIKGLPNPDGLANNNIDITLTNFADEASLKKQVKSGGSTTDHNYYSFSFRPEDMDCVLYEGWIGSGQVGIEHGTIKSIKTTKNSITYTITDFGQFIPYLKDVPDEDGFKAVSALKSKLIYIDVYGSTPDFPIMSIQNFDDVGRYRNTNKGKTKITNKWTLK